MQLKNSNFAGCCGIKIIHDLGGTEVTTGNNRKNSIASLEKALKEIIKYGDKRYWYGGKPGIEVPPKALSLIAINTKQKEKYHKILNKEGFKLVSKGWNRNHSGWNYLYSLEEKKP